MEYEPAILQGVRDHLIKSFTVKTLSMPKTIGVEPGGHPPPLAGSFYISIDEDGIQNEGQPEQAFLGERMNLAIWISIRSGQQAPDRTGNIYLKEMSGFGPMERQIKALLHGNQTLRQDINVLLTENTDNIQEIQEPCWWQGRTTTVESAADWSGETGGKAVGWLVRKLRFIGFRRITPTTELF